MNLSKKSRISEVSTPSAVTDEEKEAEAAKREKEAAEIRGRAKLSVEEMDAGNAGTLDRLKVGGDAGPCDVAADEVEPRLGSVRDGRIAELLLWKPCGVCKRRERCPGSEE